MGMGLRTNGRVEKLLTADVERELNELDLDVLGKERGTQAPQIKVLRERHHTAARMLAAGSKPGEVAAACRISLNRISILQSDPAFSELVQHYTTIVNVEFVDFQKKLAELGVDAAHVLQERLEDDDKVEAMSDAFLLKLVEVSADRTGHGPSTKTEVNLKVGIADKLMAARQRAGAVMKDVTPKEIDNG